MDKFLRASITKVILLIGIMGFLPQDSFSQQWQVYNQFFMNPYIYNPAYAGVDGHGVIFAMYKQQWSNIPDGPKLAHATYHVPLQGGIGLGVAAYQETAGPLRSSAGKVSGSYLLNIDSEHFFRFGMSLGAGSHQLTIPEDGLGDAAFEGQSSMYMIGDFGATYHFGHFNVGVSLPNLFTSELIPEEGGLAPPSVSPTDRVLFKMNYRGHLSHDIAVEPHIIYRYSNIIPSQYEVSTIVHVKHVAWVGGTYRQDVGLVGLLGIKFKKKFAIGAAFELGNSDFGDITGSSFEIHLGMHMGGHREKKLAHVDHHKTWFQTHSEELLRRKRQQERQDSIRTARADSIRQAQLLAKQNNQQEQTEQKDTSTNGAKGNSASTPWSPSTEVITKTTAAGNIITGTKLTRQSPNGEKDVLYSYPPPRNGGSAWAISPNTSEFEIRTDASGAREVGVKWVRIGTDGSLEEKVVWVTVGDPASTQEEQQISDNQDNSETNADANKNNIADERLTTDNRSYDELAQSDEHLEVNQGDHRLELPAGNYLIGGVYDRFSKASEVSDEVFQQGFRDTKVGYVSARGHYYLVLRSYNSLSQARKDKNKVQAVSGFEDVWVLKVNE